MTKILSNNKRTLDELIPKDDEEQKTFRPLKVQKLKEIEQDLEFKSMPLELETIPTLFLCNNDRLSTSLQCIANITGTSVFNDLIRNTIDLGIQSPIHFIHDSSIEQETISLTVQYFMIPFGYWITTQNIETGDLPEKMRSLEKRFSDNYIDCNERLIQIRGNFGNWTCPFNRIVINQYYKSIIYDITEVIRHFEASTDKIIVFKPSDEMVSHGLHECIDDLVSSLKSQYNGLLILVDKKGQDRWNDFKKILRLTSVLSHTGRKPLYQKKLVFNYFIYNDLESQEVTNHINKFLLQ